MKKIFSLTLLVLFFACNTVPDSEPVDLVAEENAITEVFETTMTKGIADRNIELFASVFADDGVFFGASPDGIHSKDTIVAGWTQSMQTTEEIPNFEHLSEPFIRIQPDGKTAVVMIQYYWKLMTPLPLRQTFWMVKRDSTWLIDFYEMSVIPYAEQYPALNAAVAKEQE